MRDELIELIKSRRDPCDIGACPFVVDDVRPCSLCETESLADHLIANGVTLQKWIPVSERLPEEGEKAVCIMFFGEFRILEWSYIDWMWNDGSEWWKEKDVTHWTPLPSTEGLNDTGCTQC